MTQSQGPYVLSDAGRNEIMRHLPKWQRDYRKTGRTTRMLEEARRLVLAGERVVVYCATGSHVEAVFAHAIREKWPVRIDVLPSMKALVKPVPNLPVTQFPGVWFRSIGGAMGKKVLDSMPFGGIGERSLSSLGGEGPVLFDHYALEYALTWALQEMHRWDLDLGAA